jgi:hypothetical protein
VSAFCAAFTEARVASAGDATSTTVAKTGPNSCREPPTMTYDQAISRQSIDAIWELWRRRSGTVLIPGHDVPMVLDEGEPRYLVSREGAVAAWFGTGLDQLTVFDIAMR